MKSSDWFRQMVGEYHMMYTPAARAIWETLRGMEEHHAKEHKDCEDDLLRKLDDLAAQMQDITGIKSLPRG